MSVPFGIAAAVAIVLVLFGSFWLVLFGSCWLVLSPMKYFARLFSAPGRTVGMRLTVAAVPFAVWFAAGRLLPLDPSEDWLVWPGIVLGIATGFATSPQEPSSRGGSVVGIVGAIGFILGLSVQWDRASAALQPSQVLFFGLSFLAALVVAYAAAVAIVNQTTTWEREHGPSTTELAWLLRDLSLESKERLLHELLRVLPDGEVAVVRVLDHWLSRDVGPGPSSTAERE